MGAALGCSAGVAVFPEDTLSGRELIELADGALYVAKGAGRGQTRRFDARHVTTLTPEEQRDAVRALLANPAQLTPAFQPMVCLASGRILGYEALARFDDPSGRTPTEWFTLARLCGLGSQLQALAAARAFAVPGRPAGAYLSINLEPSSLGSPDVEAVLPSDLGGIVIEITEQELISDVVRLNDELSALRDRARRHRGRLLRVTARDADATRDHQDRPRARREPPRRPGQAGADRFVRDLRPPPPGRSRRSVLADARPASIGATVGPRSLRRRSSYVELVLGARPAASSLALRPAPLCLQPPRARSLRRLRRAPRAGDGECTLQARRKPLERQRAVARLVAGVLGDGADDGAAAGDDAPLVLV